MGFCGGELNNEYQVPGDQHKCRAPVEWSLWVLWILWFSELKSVSSCFSNFWWWTAFLLPWIRSVPIMWYNITVHETDVNKCFLLNFVSAGIPWCLCELATFLFVQVFWSPVLWAEAQDCFKLTRKQSFQIDWHWWKIGVLHRRQREAESRVENRKKGKGCISSPYHVGVGELLRVGAKESSWC